MKTSTICHLRMKTTVEHRERFMHFPRQKMWCFQKSIFTVEFSAVYTDMSPRLMREALEQIIAVIVKITIIVNRIVKIVFFE